MSFEQYMQKVDSILSQKVGLTSSDLPDVCYADWHEEGVTPKSAAARAIKYANE